MLIDTTPLARIGRAEILAEHKLVRWPDGSTAAVHQVRHPDAMDGTHLALQIAPLPARQPGAWFVFPVMAVCPPLAEDLRAQFDGADALHQAVMDWQAREAVGAMRRAA
jgi:hypothetical protein